jgi:spore maturation protein SpmA
MLIVLIQYIAAFVAGKLFFEACKKGDLDTAKYTVFITIALLSSIVLL